MQYGELALQKVELPLDTADVKVELAGKAISATATKDDDVVAISFDEPVCISDGETLVVS